MMYYAHAHLSKKKKVNVRNETYNRRFRTDTLRIGWYLCSIHTEATGAVTLQTLWWWAVPCFDPAWVQQLHCNSDVRCRCRCSNDSWQVWDASVLRTDASRFIPKIASYDGSPTHALHRTHACRCIDTYGLIFPSRLCTSGLGPGSESSPGSGGGALKWKFCDFYLYFFATFERWAFQWTVCNDPGLQQNWTGLFGHVCWNNAKVKPY